MKSPVFLLLVLVAISCQPRTEADPNGETQDTTIIDSPAPMQKYSCYEGTLGKDVFRMETEINKNVATGKLQYLFHEKDQSRGEIKGMMYGDTLLADYTFNAEGSTSVRQVIFLIDETMVREGYGPMEEKNGKQVFTNWRGVSFEQGVKMMKISCTPDTTVQSNTPTPLSGTWELKSIEGEKRPFDKIFTGRKPQLIFSDSAPNVFSGNSGCNSIRGNYSVNGTDIDFDKNFIMTKMACEGDAEMVFLNAFRTIDHYDIKSQTLTLLDGSKPVMRFILK